ncbi:hypothetical protein VTK26DRAFT_6268 [Humicola hyalothermophila]
MRPRLRIPARPRLSVPAQSPLLSFAQQSRSRHSLHPLRYVDDNFSQTGIPDFMSPTAFNIAWTQYQSHLITRLNALTAGGEYENKHVKDILLLTARSPSGMDPVIFNHASMMHNNEFFFKHLSLKEVPIPEPLKGHLEKSFGSIETLRTEMAATAASMFGPGFVWLVKTSIPGMPVAFKVLTTYLAGTPYPGAHWRRQDTDMNTSVSSWQPDGVAAGRSYLDRSAYGAGRPNTAAAKKVEFAPGGIDLHPVLCLNTWQHVWLWDYGFGTGDKGGKFEFAQKWWKRIDWDQVQKEANIQKLEMSTKAAPTAAPAAAATA